jgi:tetratricopeptide (TPR) repeat protein
MGRGMKWAGAVLAGALAACVMQGKEGARRPAATEESPGTALPAPPPTERPAAPPPRQFRLGPAAGALVAQAHRQAGGGDYGQAAATLERALRIEPDNPLVWIELGRVRMGESNFDQAESLGRKSLTLATGDPAAQAAAWRLIGDASRARDHNTEAAEAYRRADGLAPR